MCCLGQDEFARRPGARENNERSGWIEAIVAGEPLPLDRGSTRFIGGCATASHFSARPLRRQRCAHDKQVACLVTSASAEPESAIKSRPSIKANNGSNASQDFTRKGQF
jgi:hypothetical protein